MKLPKDITRCGNESCAQKTKCLRYLSGKIDTKAAYLSDFQPNQQGKCWYYIPEKHYNQSNSYSK
jgi:hypothetical protein